MNYLTGFQLVWLALAFGQLFHLAFWAAWNPWLLLAHFWPDSSQTCSGSYQQDCPLWEGSTPTSWQPPSSPSPLLLLASVPGLDLRIQCLPLLVELIHWSSQHLKLPISGASWPFASAVEIPWSTSYSLSPLACWPTSNSLFLADSLCRFWSEFSWCQFYSSSFPFPICARPIWLASLAMVSCFWLEAWPTRCRQWATSPSGFCFWSLSPRSS